MSKDEKIAAQAQEIKELKHENELLRKALFGESSERFIGQPAIENQATLFEQELKEVTAQGTNNEGEETETEKEQITYERKKAKAHPGRHTIPDHIPTRQVIIEPEEDTTGMVKIGEEVTTTLEYTPASLVKVITRRPKYARPNDEGIVIGRLPLRPIERGIPEASLLAHILVSKFIDHLPFYRQIQRFKREYQWNLPSSTINDWFIACCTLLEPLYEYMTKLILESDYLQADESPLKVLDRDKPGSSHQGYQWVYRSPCNDIVVFNYRKGRGMHGPKEMLKDFKGYLQTDGYKVYDKIGKRADINLVGCWAHGRRKFFDAKSNDKQRSEYALKVIQQIYALDKKAKETTDLKYKQKYREEHITPQMIKLKEWAEENQNKVLPKSPIGKAINYLLLQWPKLIAVLENGKLEIDNNLIENKIRPLALGRKNYLFAGSHAGAQRIAMMYSFFATCKAKDINPYNWLKETLEKLPETKLSELGKLLPGAQED